MRLLSVSEYSSFCQEVIKHKMFRSIFQLFFFYFSKLFLSQINENDSNVYEIHFVRSEIMNCIIDFAYTFDCDIIEANLNELLATAEYFCFFSLVDYCAEFMMKILNPNNCISLMRSTRFLARFNLIFI